MDTHAVSVITEHLTQLQRLLNSLYKPLTCDFEIKPCSIPNIILIDVTLSAKNGTCRGMTLSLNTETTSLVELPKYISSITRHIEHGFKQSIIQEGIRAMSA